MRTAMTAVEMLIVLSIVAVLSSMALPMIVPALRQGRVNEAANLLLRVHAEARSLARSAPVGSSGHYGVVLVNGPRTWFAITHGATASPGTVLEHAGQPVARHEIDQGIAAFWGADAASATAGNQIGWLYRSGTAYPSTSPAAATGTPGWWTSIGVPGSTVCGHLSLRTVDAAGRHRASVSIYEIGVGHAHP